MKGKYEINIKAKHCRYRISIKHNISVIRGNSATGKTTIVNHIRTKKLRGDDYPIIVDANCNYDVLSGDFKLDSYNVQTSNNTIFFADENVPYLGTQDFANLVKGSNNYFVLITRRNLSNLPINISAVYELIKDTANDAYYNYNEAMYNGDVVGDSNYNTVLTEDSKSGRDLFRKVYGSAIVDTPLSSASKLYLSIARTKQNESVLLIGDGAAYGAYIEDSVKLISKGGFRCTLWLPESFEYLLLISRIVRVKDMDVVYNAYEYSDSSKYFSLERYFTALVAEYFSKYGFKYDKYGLPDEYMTDECVKRFINVIPLKIRPKKSKIDSILSKI